MNSIELNACYNIIKELLDKNKKIERILKDKLGIEIINHKDNDLKTLKLKNGQKRKVIDN